MMVKGLVKKLTAAFVVAASAFVAIVAFGATVYYGLQLVMPPLAAAALTSGGFALVALLVALVFLKASGAADAPEEYEEPEGLGGRAYALFRQRPVLGIVAALAGGWIFLRNPALATMVAAAFTERSRPRYRR